MHKYVKNSRNRPSLEGEKHLAGGPRRSKSVYQNSFGQMEFDEDSTLEWGISHKFEQEEMTSNIACSQIESAIEMMSEEEVGRNEIDYKRDCRVVELVEVSEVNRGQPEYSMEHYSQNRREERLSFYFHVYLSISEFDTTSCVQEIPILADNVRSILDLIFSINSQAV